MPSETPSQITVTTAEKAYQITAWRAVAIVAGAVLVTFVGTAFTFIGTADSDHYRLERTEDRVEALEQNTVRQDVLTQTLNPMQQDIRDIKLYLMPERNQ